MAAAQALDNLLRDPRLWRGPSVNAAHLATETTGYAALDAALPGGGWPKNGITELLHAFDGLGELTLLLPTLARLTQTGRIVVLVGAPYLPYPAALLAQDIDLRQLYFITALKKESLWTTEQCLRSGACAVVIGWQMAAEERAIRRLQVAAEHGQTLGFVFRPAAAAANPSPATVRIRIDAVEDETHLEILKCRGGRAPARKIRFRCTHP